MKRAMLVVFCGVCGSLAFGYDWAINPGDGSAANPYQISTAEQLASIGSDASLLNQHFIVTSDINLSTYTFTAAVIAPDPINTNMSFDGTAFTGSFDGQGHKILNMKISIGGGDYLGLFGYLGTGAVVENLTLESVSISGGEMSYYLGVITGYNKGTIRNCSVVGNLYAGDNNILTGGIAGQSDTSIIQCSAYVFFSIGGGSIGIGGLVGQNSGQIQRCFATGRITSYYYSYRIGGLVGDNVNGTIENSYAGTKATCDYTYIKQVGGLVGRSSGGTILNCYSTGQISPGIGATNIGGFIGLCTGAVTITNCFWDTTTSTRTSSAGGTGKTTAEMKTLSTFTGAGWDFVGESVNGVHEIWRMCADGVSYPRLSWEYAASGDFACADGVTLDDLFALAAQWLTDYALTPTTFDYACDANRDDGIDMADLNILSQNWPGE